MISNPDLPVLKPHQWPRTFSPWQLLSLVPAVVNRLHRNARVLEIEVGGQSLLSSLARNYPGSQFIGLTSLERARAQGMSETSARNLHFRTVERFDLGRFRQVDLVLALGGVQDRSMLREVGAILAPGGQLVLREEEVSEVTTSERFAFGTRFLSTMNARWASPAIMRHTLTQRALSDAFESVHVIRLPEDPGYFYYIARAA